LEAQRYLERRGEGPLCAPLLEPALWILGLHNTSIMNLLDIPHFECGKYKKGCVKKLLVMVHGGILWMGRPVSINFYLIAQITGLPTDGEKPEKYLKDETKEKSMFDEIKAKYGIYRGIEVSGLMTSISCDDIWNHISRFEINAQVMKRKSAHRSSSSCDAVHKG
jgi:hypothetical protein